jgi:hypothetical protein
MAQKSFDQNTEREIRLCRLYSVAYVIVVWPVFGLMSFGWPWWPFASLAVLIVIAAVLHVGPALDRIDPYRWYGRGGLIICHMLLVIVCVVTLDSGSYRESAVAVVALGLPLVVLLHLAQLLTETHS